MNIEIKDPIVALTNSLLYMQQRLVETEQKLSAAQNDLLAAEKQITELNERNKGLCDIASERLMNLSQCHFQIESLQKELKDKKFELQWEDYDPKKEYPLRDKMMLPFVLGLYSVNDNKTFGNGFGDSINLSQFSKMVDWTMSVYKDGKFFITANDREGWKLEKVCILYVDEFVKLKSEDNNNTAE